jgi:hypothetical protein
LRPIEDAVPVVVDPTSELGVVLATAPELTPDDAQRSQVVMCNTLFAASPRDTAIPLPPLRTDFVYERPPCVAPHADARLAAVANALAVAALVAGWIWVSRRARAQGPGHTRVEEFIGV